MTRVLLLLNDFPHSSHLYFLTGGGLNGLFCLLLGKVSSVDEDDVDSDGGVSIDCPNPPRELRLSAAEGVNKELGGVLIGCAEDSRLNGK